MNPKTPTTCEPTEEQRARARQAYQQWQQGDIIARSGLPSSILDFIAQHAAQESSRVNERIREAKHLISVRMEGFPCADGDACENLKTLQGIGAALDGKEI